MCLGHRSRRKGKEHCQQRGVESANSDLQTKEGSVFAHENGEGTIAAASGTRVPKPDISHWYLYAYGTATPVPDHHTRTTVK
jgi:hypothetical protein